MLVRESILRAARRGRSEQVAQLSMPVARQIVLQLARRDIGQLTDIETDVYRAMARPGKRLVSHINQVLSATMTPGSAFALDRAGTSAQTLVTDERRSW
jgi:hypothetical protein